MDGQENLEVPGLENLELKVDLVTFEHPLTGFLVGIQNLQLLMDCYSGLVTLMEGFYGVSDFVDDVDLGDNHEQNPSDFVLEGVPSHPNVSLVRKLGLEVAETLIEERLFVRGKLLGAVPFRVEYAFGLLIEKVHIEHLFGLQLVEEVEFIVRGNKQLLAFSGNDEIVIFQVEYRKLALHQVVALDLEIQLATLLANQFFERRNVVDFNSEGVSIQPLDYRVGVVQIAQDRGLDED